jgi:hypothetical protein
MENVRSLCKAASLTTVARDLNIYKLGLVGEQEIRWDRGDTDSPGDFIFFCGMRHDKYELGTQFLST